MRLEVVTVVNIKIAIFWNVRQQHFEEPTASIFRWGQQVPPK
jgi:hypothetical protein